MLYEKFWFWLVLYAVGMIATTNIISRTESYDSDTFDKSIEGEEMLMIACQCCQSMFWPITIAWWTYCYCRNMSTYAALIAKDQLKTFLEALGFLVLIILVLCTKDEESGNIYD